MINQAKNNGNLAHAASPGGVRTVMKQDNLHLDRQTSTNSRGSHKVAIQNNKGNPSTIGQVVIYPNYKPSARMVNESMPSSK
jgi:hypothetical protein